MTTTVKAVYQNGVFRPAVALPLPDGTSVELTVHAHEKPGSSNGTLNVILDEIAAMPPEGPQDGFSGADHNQILYPNSGSGE